MTPLTPLPLRLRILSRLPLAMRILLHKPGRLAISTAGILLAIVLLFTQAGFRNGMFDSQAELIHRLNGQLVLVSPLKVLMYATEPFPSRRLEQARACPGVQAVSPLYLEGDRSIWKNPRTGQTRPIRVLAFDPNEPEPVLNIPGLSAYREALKKPDTVLFDTWSRDYYGHPTAGTRAELSGHAVTVVGTFHLGTDFLTDGTVLMSDRNFKKLFGGPSAATHLQSVPVGVVRLKPGADVQKVQRALSNALPGDVQVLTRDELVDLETNYWEDNTAIGIIFSLGWWVGFGIGVVICYQVLYSNVSNYLPQFATLKAMGFTDWFLVGVVVQQGVYLALLAFLPAVGVSQVVFWVVGELTGLLLFFTGPRLLFILAVAVVMCMISGLVAVRRVLAADPAEVFK